MKNKKRNWNYNQVIKEIKENGYYIYENFFLKRDLSEINDALLQTFNYIKNFGSGDGRIKFAALIHNKPSKAKVDYQGYEIDKSKDPAWIVFPWEEWDK